MRLPNQPSFELLPSHGIEIWRGGKVITPTITRDGGGVKTIVIDSPPWTGDEPRSKSSNP